MAYQIIQNAKVMQCDETGDIGLLIAGKVRPLSGGEAAVYSTEETVVGTWIDGKPIYRISVFGVTGTRNAENDMPISVPSLVYLDRLVSFDGGMYCDGGVFLQHGDDLRSFVYKSGHIVIKASSTYWENREAFFTIEYTKTTDEATVAIPSAVALTDAYEEGVNEA